MQRYLKSFAIFLITAVTAAALFTLLYRYDNKYTHPGPMGRNGILLLNENDLLVYPIDGWEFYREQLLSPADFQTRTLIPDTYLYIGQYSGFGLDNPGLEPFGTATYRLHIFTGYEAERSYMLELPEIFSAYRLFINGRQLAGEGVPAPDYTYQPNIFHSSITFQAAGRIEIIFQTANYDHYYSGLVYPPAFGTVKEVQKVINIQLFIGSMLFFTAVIIGAYFFWTGLLAPDRKSTLWFGILCFLYAGSISHILIHLLGIGTVGLWYRLEDFCFYGTMLCITRIYTMIRQEKGTKLREDKGAVFLLLFGAAVCLSAILLPSLIAAGASGLAVFYSSLVTVYKLVVICHLLYSALRAQNSFPYSAALLAASGIYTVSLGTDALILLYEPIRFGWPTEIGGFLFILILGGIITADTVGNFREKQRLLLQQEYMEKQLFQQREHYEKLSDQITRTKKDRHDLQHHLTVIKTCCDGGDLERLSAYLEGLTASLTLPSEVPLCENFAVSSLAGYYLALARKEQIMVTAAIHLPQTAGCISDHDLCVVTGNLLENAIEASRYCPEGQRFLSIHMKYTGYYLAILVDNSFDGNCQLQEDRFYSRKRNYRTEGIGISSVRAIADQYLGQAAFQIKDKVFEASVLLKYR